MCTQEGIGQTQTSFKSILPYCFSERPHSLYTTSSEPGFASPVVGILQKSRSFSSLPSGISSQGPIQLTLEDIVNFNVFISFLLGLSPRLVMKVLFIIPYLFLTNGTRNLKPLSIIFPERSQPFKTKPPLFSNLICNKPFLSCFPTLLSASKPHWSFLCVVAGMALEGVASSPVSALVGVGLQLLPGCYSHHRSQVWDLALFKLWPAALFANGNKLGLFVGDNCRQKNPT